MASLKSVFKVLAIVAGAFAGFIVLVFVALGLWMHFSFKAAQDHATAFCAATPVGAPIADVAARAQADAAIYLPNDSDLHVVRYIGWGRNDCELAVVDGRVTATMVTSKAFE